MVARPATGLPAGAGWAFEPKADGFLNWTPGCRACCCGGDDSARIFVAPWLLGLPALGVPDVVDWLDAVIGFMRTRRL